MEEEVKFPKKKKYKKLEKAFKELLQVTYERAGDNNNWEGTNYWNKKAGLKINN